MIHDDGRARLALRVGLTLLAAALGGFGVQSLGVSAGWLVGAASTTILLVALGLPVRVPAALRDGAFVILGISLGAGISPGFLALAAQNSVSFLMLALAIIVIMAFNSWMLVRFFGIDPATAVVGTSPGALSMTLALAESGFGDPRGVAILQSMRLALIVTLLPVLIGLAGYGGDPSRLTSQAVMPPLQFLLVVLAATAAGFALSRLRSPAPYLIAGILVSSVSHATGYAHGAAPPMLLIAAIIGVGANIGTRFAGVTRDEFIRHALGSIAATFAAVLIAFGFAWLAAQLSGAQTSNVFFAYAPGAVEAMAALAIALGVNPALVAAHHILRIFLLMIGLPAAVTLMCRRWPHWQR